MNMPNALSEQLLSACKGRKVALWGAGPIGQEVLAGLADRGIAPVAVFDDYGASGSDGTG